MTKEKSNQKNVLSELGKNDGNDGDTLVQEDPDKKKGETEFSKTRFAEGRPRVHGGIDVYAESMSSTGNNQYSTQRKNCIKHGHWSVAWADLMMTMFILFMVMFVYKTADREFLSGEGLGTYSGNKVGRQIVDGGPGGSNDFREFEEKAFSKIYNFSKITNLEEELKDFAEISLTPDKTLRIIVTGDLLFPLGKKEMEEGGLSLLRKIAVFLKDTPYKINVVGHTDNLPMNSSDTPSNWELSTDRACAVVHYLIGETNLPARQFYVTGHGEYRPVVPNDSPGNRARNRRVEIFVTKELPGALPLGGADF